MMTGLGVLKAYGYFLGRRLERGDRVHATVSNELDDVATKSCGDHRRRRAIHGDKGFDVFRQLERVEWDTLMFFYGVILAIGGLGALGYLALASASCTAARAHVGEHLVGLASALVDNMPIMFAVLR